MLKFNQLGDDRGHLVVAESMKEIPFDIKRIFYIYGTEEGVVRGQHANRKSKFVLINLRGSCKVLIDDGDSKNIVTLDQPHIGVFLDSMVWKDMYDFSHDSLLLVLSDQLYDGSEYIRNYEEYINEIRLRGECID
jgi:hypothetical protein